MFHLEAPPGFKPFDPRGDLTIYHRHLPHWRQNGATYFVTFRQADSLPQSKLDELKSLRQEWREKHFHGGEPPTDSETIRQQKNEWEELTKTTMEKTERWLDRGMGSCELKRPEIREVVSEALLSFDGKRYQLGAFVLMPNHVHAVIRPFQERNSLEEVLRSRKSWTSRNINKVIEKGGAFWQQESFDRIVRDAEHLWKVIRYIGENPAKAGISEEQSMRWIRPEWEAVGWGFVDAEQ